MPVHQLWPCLGVRAKDALVPVGAAGHHVAQLLPRAQLFVEPRQKRSDRGAPKENPAFGQSPKERHTYFVLFWAVQNGVAIRCSTILMDLFTKKVTPFNPRQGSIAFQQVADSLVGLPRQRRPRGGDCWFPFIPESLRLLWLLRFPKSPFGSPDPANG